MRYKLMTYTARQVWDTSKCCRCRITRDLAYQPRNTKHFRNRKETPSFGILRPVGISKKLMPLKLIYADMNALNRSDKSSLDSLRQNYHLGCVACENTIVLHAPATVLVKWKCNWLVTIVTKCNIVEHWWTIPARNRLETIPGNAISDCLKIWRKCK